MSRQILIALLFIALLPLDAAERFDLKRHPVPRVWRDKSDAGRFTALTAFPRNWQRYRKELRQKFFILTGVEYDPKLPLELKKLNSFFHEGIRLQNVTYQTRPGVYTTATIYYPEGKGPFPAVMSLQGHRQSGRLSPAVQIRNFALAKSGYLVLSPDTFGQGERSTVHTRYEYHGKNLGAQLFNIGETLLGSILVDNMRGVDLLCSMPEVDKTRIGATGVSGGGNQTMYLAAMDDRIKAAVPVCSAGSYDSYIGNANCVCETLPGGLLLTEMAGIFALTAPRALMLCNGLYDVKTFSPQEMLRSFDAAMHIYRLYDAQDNFVYRIFNHAHEYSTAAREAMLGFFALHLKKEGRGMPVKTPYFTTLKEEKLLAFTPGKRPDKVFSIAARAEVRGKKLLKQLYSRKSIDAEAAKKALASVLKLQKKKVIAQSELPDASGWKRIQIELDDGKFLPLVIFEGRQDIRIFTHINGKKALPPETLERYLAMGGTAVLLDLSATGENNPEPEPVMAHHQSARNALWQGRTLAGEWTAELCAVANYLKKRYPGEKITLHGFRETALSSLYASIFLNDINTVILEEAPVSFLFTQQSSFYGMSLFTPGILNWGDIPLAAALSSARISWISPRKSDGSHTVVPQKEINILQRKLK